jgi:non-lysosomal glucosylceramidase
MKRRRFIKTIGLTGAAILAAPGRTIAGPFKPGDFSGFQVPADKKLGPAWVLSLRERGTPTSYRISKAELRYIGMPVGGICAGTMYLGGDGRLWLWDVFNHNQRGIDARVIEWKGRKPRPNDGSTYVDPASGIRPIRQDFALAIDDRKIRVVKPLDEDHWDEIELEATYPIGNITFQDPALPVAIILRAYSPFIPMDEENSGLPVTIMSFDIVNRRPKKVRVSLTGWLENGILFDKQLDEGLFRRKNLPFTDARVRGIRLGAESDDEAVRSSPGFGSFCLALLKSSGGLSTAQSDDEETARLTAAGIIPSSPASQPMAVLGSARDLEIREAWRSHFFIAWHFPNLSVKTITDKIRYYSNRFEDASAVASFVGRNFEYLSGTTGQWHDAWYDSSLPWWFLERTFVNTSTLATTTCLRVKSSRFYAWEGVGCCEGTWTHVWHYAQAVARIFPALEKDTGARVDLGLLFDAGTGMIHYRGPGTSPAIDGQAGTVLRIYREHRMSGDDLFLRENWGKINKAVQYILRHDANKEGLTDGQQPNTLDADWFGDIVWIAGLCLAAVRAREEMALETGDTIFAARCREYFDKGKKRFEEKLFDGEYFIQKPDQEKGRRGLGGYNTCHIDQLLGQSWAFQAGLGRIIDKEKTQSALRSLWKYNFTPDVGGYIAAHKGGRRYALAGEGGMIMNTNPQGEEKPYGEKPAGRVGYFHECMSGFEHQVASHMMGEGLVDESLIVTRMIHDRYHAAKRNPFNEIECSDHYARAMASYGTFITACGFEHPGPQGFMQFAPRLCPDDFKAAFTTAESWGTFRQRRSPGTMEARIAVIFGMLTLKTLQLEFSGEIPERLPICERDGESVACHMSRAGDTLTIEFQAPVIIRKQEELRITI